MTDYLNNFKTYLLLFGLGTVLGLVLHIYPCKQKDYAAYAALLQSSNPLQNEAVSSCSQQKRTEVRKRIWYQDDAPLHIRIESPESELFFFQKNNQIEVTEQLGSVVCIMQEELYYEAGKPMQKVRYMEGESACYHYHSHLFVAQNVKLWKYQLEGHIPPETFLEGSPIMSATAHSVEFILKGEKLDFTAHQMRAKLNTKEHAL